MTRSSSPRLMRRGCCACRLGVGRSASSRHRHQDATIFSRRYCPAGDAVLFTIAAAGQASNAQIAVLDLRSGTQTVLLSGGSHGQYAASGHLVYGAAGTLRAVGFDLDTLTIRGSAVPVVERVVTKGTGAANFAMSRDGTLVYESGDIASGAERTLVWVDRQGREEVIAAAPKRAYTVSSHLTGWNARRAGHPRPGERHLGVGPDPPESDAPDLDPGLNRAVVWTPDGKHRVLRGA